jgi:hypothetical protein
MPCSVSLLENRQKTDGDKNFLTESRQEMGCGGGKQAKNSLVFWDINENVLYRWIQRSKAAVIFARENLQ